MRINKKILDAINNSSQVAIFIHMRPDGDAFGSSCAMKMMLEKMGKYADIYVDADDISVNFTFIKGVSVVNKPTLQSYDTAIALDCADFTRLGKYGEMYQTIETRLNIDHHISNDNFGEINLVKNTSSTAEIVYAICKSLAIEFDKDIATAIYTGISADTGCFQHGNTTSSTHRIASQLFKFDLETGKINYNLFKKRTWKQMMLLQTGLKNLKLYLDDKLAIMCLKESDFINCGITKNESFGLVDYCVNIENVEVGILISEIKPNLFAVSIRGKGNVDCSKLAATFGGGGHPDASGCNIFGTANTVKDKLIKTAGKFIC